MQIPSTTHNTNSMRQEKNLWLIYTLKCNTLCKFFRRTKSQWATVLVNFYRSQYTNTHIHARSNTTTNLMKSDVCLVYHLLCSLLLTENTSAIRWGGKEMTHNVEKSHNEIEVRLCHAWTVKIGLVHSDDSIIPESPVVVSLFCSVVLLRTFLFVLFWFDSFGETEHTLVLFSLNSTVLTCGQLNCRSSIFLSLVSINNNNFW